MSMITIEQFTQILRYKIEYGTDRFTGRRTGNTYHVYYDQNRCRWHLEINGSRRYSRVTFNSIANTIWDTELRNQERGGGYGAD